MRSRGAGQNPAAESFWVNLGGLEFIERAAIALVTCAVAALFARRAKIRPKGGRGWKALEGNSNKKPHQGGGWENTGNISLHDTVRECIFQ